MGQTYVQPERPFISTEALADYFDLFRTWIYSGLEHADIIIYQCSSLYLSHNHGQGSCGRNRLYDPGLIPNWGEGI
jgi:hypothetical protein